MTTLLKLSIAIAVVVEIYRLWQQPHSRYVLVRATGQVRRRRIRHGWSQGRPKAVTN